MDNTHEQSYGKLFGKIKNGNKKSINCVYRKKRKNNLKI